MTHLEKEDIDEISNLRVEFAKVVSDAGQLTLQSKLLEVEIKEINSKLEEHSVKFKQLLTKEQVLLKRLSEKYGTSEINFETGELTSQR